MNKALFERRSIRVFKDAIIPKKDILELIEAARWAPSHCNTQGTRFIIVDDEKIKKRIVDNGGAGIIKKAKQGILVLYKKESDNIEYKDHIQSASAAIENLCLQAHLKGIGTCWICHLPRKKVLRKIFKIPSFYDVIAYIMIGYPKNVPTNVPRKKPIEKVISRNKFSIKEEPSNHPFKIIMRKVYYLLPVSLKKKINKTVDNNLVKKFQN